jgi:hypothetical protein
MVLRGMGAIARFDLLPWSMLPVMEGSERLPSPNGFENGFPDKRIESPLHAAAMPPTKPTTANRETTRKNSLMGTQRIAPPATTQQNKAICGLFRLIFRCGT